jgi:hypothetical protein
MPTSNLSIARPPDQAYEALRLNLPQSGIQVADGVPNTSLLVRIPIKTKGFKFNGLAEGQIKLVPQGAATVANLTATVGFGSFWLESCLGGLIAGSCWTVGSNLRPGSPISSILFILGLVTFIGSIVSIYQNNSILPKDALKDLQTAITAALSGEALRGVQQSAPQSRANSPASAQSPPVPPVSNLVAAGSEQNVALLAQLAELHGKGILTTDEFESKKKQILQKIGL